MFLDGTQVVAEEEEEQADEDEGVEEALREAEFVILFCFHPKPNIPHKNTNNQTLLKQHDNEAPAPILR